jgi:hypothetical protein
MPDLIDEILVENQLHVTKDASTPEALGRGPAKIKGSAYLQGPVLMGNDSAFGSSEATLMVGPPSNSDNPNAELSTSTLGETKHVGDHLHVGDTVHEGNLITSNLIDCTGQKCNWTSSRINIQSWKGFDIQHPSKENHRLRYVCLEGPEGGVYIRGRIKNKTEIELPNYWKDLVDIQSITISLTPVGAHQDVIVKRWDENKIYLQSKGGMPIDCFYHIFAERKDGEKLIVEYQGETPADYPGDSSQYSIAGYDYGRKE